MEKANFVLNIVILVVLAMGINGAFGGKGITDKEVQKNLKYVMDKRTQICFAVSGYNGAGGAVYTAVDCEKVKDALANGWSR